MRIKDDADIARRLDHFDLADGVPASFARYAAEAASLYRNGLLVCRRIARSPGAPRPPMTVPAGSRPGPGPAPPTQDATWPAHPGPLSGGGRSLSTIRKCVKACLTNRFAAGDPAATDARLAWSAAFTGPALAARQAGGPPMRRNATGDAEMRRPVRWRKTSIYLRVKSILAGYLPDTWFWTCPPPSIRTRLRDAPAVKQITLRRGMTDTRLRIA
jgi:hypothetical protein